MSLLYLTREDVAGLLPDVPAQLDLVEETYRAVGAGRVELPPKPGIHPRPDSFIHAMPAYLRDDDVAALKWVAGYPANKERGLPARPRVSTAAPGAGSERTWLDVDDAVHDAREGRPQRDLDGRGHVAGRAEA